LISRKSVFDQYLGRGPRPLSCHHFSSLFAWKDFFEFSFEVIDDRLCVFAGQDGESFLYLPPLGGELDASTVKACFGRMGKSRIARVENISENQLPVFKDLGYNAYLKAHEYLYRRKDLEDLAGHAYKSKRHDIHVFDKQYPQAVFRAYAPQDLKGCLSLYSRWAADRKARGENIAEPDVYRAMLDDNARVHKLLIEHARELELIGRVVEVDGVIAGYTFGYPLDTKTFCVLLEVTDLDKTGLAAYIFNRFCADEAVRGFELINTMDDFGMPNVARTKKSYHPCQLLPVYTVKGT